MPNRAKLMETASGVVPVLVGWKRGQVSVWLYQSFSLHDKHILEIDGGGDDGCTVVWIC